jgi:hypothetical protein
MPVESFVASRWTRGNHLFPTVIEVTDTAVIRRKRSWFSKNELSIHLQRVASVRVQTGFFWSDILVESTGGTDPFTSHGHTKADAQRIKELVESAQTAHLPGSADAGPTKACPFCAERVKLAARACRYCGRDLPEEPTR